MSTRGTIAVKIDGITNKLHVTGLGTLSRDWLA